MASGKLWLTLYLVIMILFAATGSVGIHRRVVFTVSDIVYSSFLRGIADLSILLHGRRVYCVPVAGQSWSSAYDRAVSARRSSSLIQAGSYILFACRRAQTFSRSDPRWSAALSERARIERELGHYLEAEACLATLLRKQEKEGETMAVARTLNRISSILLQQAMYDRKLVGALIDRAERIVRRLGGPMHPELAAVYHNRAMIYHYRGCLDKAEELYCRALDIRVRVLGENAFMTAETYGDLGLLYGETKRLRLCQDYIRRAKKAYAMSVGPGHPWIAWYAEQLGVVFLKNGRFSEAAGELEQARRLRTLALGADDPMVTRVENLLKAMRKYR